MMAMDELNVIRASKALYEKLDDANEKAFVELVIARYRDITGETVDEQTALGWLMFILLGYNPVTEFVYETEVVRKRERFAESMIASSNKLAALRRAMSLWLNQTGQYLVLVEDKAVIEGYRANGVKKVRWFTQEDERRCPECAELHGKVFSINKIPPKPHRKCRCYVEPVQEERKNENA